jgi:hypothetical protein
MSTAADPKTIANHPAVRLHTFICLGALVVALFGLLERGFGAWSLFPVFVGSLGLAARWRLTPVLFLMSLGALLWVGAINRRFGFHATSLFGLGEFIFCAGVLAFVSANYRLHSFVDRIFPADTRLPTPKKGARLVKELRAPVQPPIRRSADHVTNREILLLLVTLPLWAAVAQAAWAWLQTRENPPLELSPRRWQAILLVWMIGLPTILIASFLSYRGWNRWHAEEATLFLQDQVWRETRKEQRRLGEWLAWARKRRRNAP